jgi:hypothetical protein
LDENEDIFSYGAGQANHATGGGYLRREGHGDAMLWRTPFGECIVRRNPPGWMAS